MDLFTANAAYSTHAQAAQRADREREFRRIAKERAAATLANAAATSEPQPKPQRQRRLVLGAVFRARLRSAH